MGSGPAAPPPGYKPPPATKGPVAGLGAGKIIFWGITATVLALVVLGAWSLVHWWNTSEYEGYLRGGEDWMAKGYLTDAEINFKKAEAIFPSDPRTKEAFAQLAQAREDQKRRGTAPNAILGPIAPPSIMPVDAQQRMMQSQMLQLRKQREIEQRVREVEQGPVMTPEMLELRKKQQEASLKAQEARRKMEQIAREEEATKRLEERRQQEEERRQQEAERKQKLEEQKKAAEERNRLAEEQRKAQQEAAQERSEQVTLGQLTTWSTGVIQESTETYKLDDFLSRAGDPDRLATSIRTALDSDARSEELKVRSPSTFQRIGKISDGDALTEFHRNLSRLVLQAEDAEVAGRNAKVVARNQLAISLRAYDKLVQQEDAVRNLYTPEATKKKADLRNEKDKLAQKLQGLCTSYMEGLNNCRGAKAAKELLQEAKDLTAARLKDLGVDPGAAPTAAPATPPKTKTYVLKDGTEIKAVTVGSMGDQYLIKDEAGEMHTVNKSEVKVIR